MSRAAGGAHGCPFRQLMGAKDATAWALLRGDEVLGFSFFFFPQDLLLGRRTVKLIKLINYSFLGTT